MLTYEMARGLRENPDLNQLLNQLVNQQRQQLISYIQ